eukprot:1157929-Pelagomonas_calceolata.AAC.3
MAPSCLPHAVSVVDVCPLLLAFISFCLPFNVYLHLLLSAHCFEPSSTAVCPLLSAFVGFCLPFNLYLHLLLSALAACPWLCAFFLGLLTLYCICPFSLVYCVATMPGCWYEHLFLADKNWHCSPTKSIIHATTLLVAAH